MTARTTGSARPLYLDCDTGIDDAIAVTYLVADPAVDLLGVGTVSGNTDAATAARNTLALLDLLQRPDVPVAVGAHHPLAGRYGGGVPQVPGGEGGGGAPLPPSGRTPAAETAAQMLVRLARAHPGRLQVLAVGPLTNIAEALRLEPALPGLVDTVTIMGGAALAPGNVTPVAEANVFHDPEAAAEVLTADWDLTLVPLDVTMDHLLEEDQRLRLAAIDHPVMPVLAAMLESYARCYLDIYGRLASAMHDPLAAAVAAAAVRPALAPTVPVTVDTTQGPGRGQTICDLRGRYAGHPPVPGARCRVVLELEEDFAPHQLSVLARFAATTSPTSGEDADGLAAGRGPGAPMSPVDLRGPTVVTTTDDPEATMSFQAYLDAAEQKTGRTPQDLVDLATARGCGPGTKAGPILEWLEADFGLGRGHGMALVHVITRGPTISERHVGTDGAHRDDSTVLRLDGVAHRSTDG